MTRAIALVDCNNFYVSCERLFQPKLEGKPVVVLSNNDGCVVSRSQEVKDLGIKMAAPWYQLKDLAKRHGIIPRSSNYSLYADLSNRVMSSHLLYLRNVLNNCTAMRVTKRCYLHDLAAPSQL